MLGADAFIISTELQSVFTRLGVSEEGGGRQRKTKTEKNRDREEGKRDRLTEGRRAMQSLSQRHSDKQTENQEQPIRQRERGRERERER